MKDLRSQLVEFNDMEYEFLKEVNESFSEYETAPLDT